VSGHAKAFTWFRSPVEKFRQSFPDAHTRHCSQLGASNIRLCKACRTLPQVINTACEHSSTRDLPLISSCSCFLSVPALNSWACSANKIEKSGSTCCDITHLWRYTAVPLSTLTFSTSLLPHQLLCARDLLATSGYVAANPSQRAAETLRTWEPYGQ